MLVNIYESRKQINVATSIIVASEQQFTAAMQTYFGQFNKLPTGQMIRQDPRTEAAQSQMSFLYIRIELILVDALKSSYRGCSAISP